MKKKIIAIIMAAAVIFHANIRTSAVEVEFTEPTLIRCTCYTASEGSITRSGAEVREGIIAGKEEWLGCVAVLYDIDMNFIGYFEFLDTGGHETLKNGTSIDVYRDSMDGCYEWIGMYGDYIYLQLIDAEG